MQRMMRAGLILLWCLTPVVRVTGGQPAADEPPVTLTALLDLAQKENPRILAERLRFDAAETRVPRAGAWEDPQVTFSLANIPWRTFDFTQEGMTGKQLSVMQRIPLRGVTGIKTDIARRSVEMADWSHRMVQQEVERQIKTAWFNMAYITRAVEIMNRKKALLGNVIRIAESRYATGEGLQQDILKAQVELSQILDGLIVLRQSRSTLAAKINTLVNRLPDSPLQAPDALTDVPFEYSARELVAMSLEARPALMAAATAINRAEQNHALAQKAWWPNLDVGMGYNQRDDRPDFISAQVALRIPLFGERKQKQDVQQARLAIEEAEARRQQEIQHLRYTVAELSNGIQQDRERMTLLQSGIIPQSSRSLESAVAGYRVDKVNFLTLLDNLKTLFDHELTYYRLLADYRVRIATMEQVAGTSLVTYE
jgi:outer membrane protein, heavy metal efflux system